MPWKEQTVEEKRKEFVRAAKGSRNLSALCRAYDISRPTAYKWLRREQSGEGFCDRSHVPVSIPTRTDAAMEELIVSVRRENPGWGAKTIRKVLENAGHDNLPCVKTCNNILKRNGWISYEESLKHKPYVRFEKENCNDMWQTDFKGDFALGDGSRCYPLTILDDHSRFSVLIAAKPSPSGVTESFREAFMLYGMPKSVLSDNGAQFAGFKKGYTQFEKWLMNHDVLPIHCRIRHPQTQGKIERFHRTMKQELLMHNSFSDLQQADNKLQYWREKYNTVRPHEALRMKCPSQVYIPSCLQYKDDIRRYEYGGQHHVIKVNSWGYVRFNSFQVYLSETMSDEYVEFRPSPYADSFIVCYRNFRIAEFDAATGSRLNRSICRL